MGLSEGTVFTELEACCVSYLMLPLFSKYWALCVIKKIMYFVCLCLPLCLFVFLHALSVYCWWQELLHRTSLENQKLSLRGEVSYLKLKLTDMEGKQAHGAERQHKAEVGLLTQQTIQCGQNGFIFNISTICRNGYGYVVVRTFFLIIHQNKLLLLSCTSCFSFSGCTVSFLVSYSITF